MSYHALCLTCGCERLFEHGTDLCTVCYNKKHPFLVRTAPSADLSAIEKRRRDDRIRAKKYRERKRLEREGK